MSSRLTAEFQLVGRQGVLHHFNGRTEEIAVGNEPGVNPGVTASVEAAAVLDQPSIP
jgi:hypothetical protein